MTARATNLAILVLLLVEFLSGWGGFLVGEASGRWVTAVEVRSEPGWWQPPLPLQ